MTLEFAKKEAARRTAELGTPHYVVVTFAALEHCDADPYLVLNRLPDGYVAVAIFNPEGESK